MSRTQPTRGKAGKTLVSGSQEPALRREQLKPGPTHKVRVLTVTDLHQRQPLFRDLARAVGIHRPDVVAVVGDVLEAFPPLASEHLSITECAAQLAALPVRHLLFVRGNHEDNNWEDFVCAWPHSQRPLVALYGTAYTAGPLIIVGFPCHSGSEFMWCRHLEASQDCMHSAPAHGRVELPVAYGRWLPQLLRQTGPAGRTLWLLHEPPLAEPLADENSCKREWQLAVERFGPLLVVAGHYHRPQAWHATLNGTVCVNVRQDENTLRFCIVEFRFPPEPSTLPTQIEVVVHPSRQRLQISPR